MVEQAGIIWNMLIPDDSNSRNKLKMKKMTKQSFMSLILMIMKVLKFKKCNMLNHSTLSPFSQHIHNNNSKVHTKYLTFPLKNNRKMSDIVHAVIKFCYGGGVH